MCLHIDNNFTASDVVLICFVYRGRIQRKTWYLEPYAGADSTATHLPWATQSRLYPPVRNFGYGLRLLCVFNFVMSSALIYIGNTQRIAGNCRLFWRDVSARDFCRALTRGLNS
jgi:hypothetical protein